MAFIRAFPAAFNRLVTTVSATSSSSTSSFKSVPSKLSRRTFLISTTTTAFSIPIIAMAEPEVQVNDITVGNGASFKSGDNVKLHYTLTINGFSEDGGKQVDSSRSRGRTFDYKYDTGAVIKGWDKGVTGMKEGGRRRLVIPPELGYGARGAGGVIPPNATLYFDIELVKVGY